MEVVTRGRTFELYGLRGLIESSMSDGRIGYHMRPGHCDIMPRDFWRYLQFAERGLCSAASDGSRSS